MDLGKRNIKLFVDSGDVNQVRRMIESGNAVGATSNPSLALKAGVPDYFAFCKEAVAICGDKPMSLEVIADDAEEIERQARLLAKLGDSVYVKVPILNTKGEYNTKVIRVLGAHGIKINCTAVFTLEHVEKAMTALPRNTPSIISVFAGRIADAGINPIPTVRAAVRMTAGRNIEILWASIRQPYNIIEAESAGAHIITCFEEMLKKVHLFGKNLHQFAIETSQMFYRDATEAGFTL